MEHHTIQTWLSNSCNKSIGAAYQKLPNSRREEEDAVPLPTRLLDLGQSKLPLSLTRLRLVTTNPEDRGRYVTLSHRWGNKHQLTLTTASMDALMRAIPFNGLPKTYRDAVKVARSLGHRYLWIDALCIIQDNERDWLQEAAKMATVYHNSSCTISVHAARDDDDGFLGIRRRRTRGDSCRSGDVSALVTTSNLSRRGWVFQERILSQRLLHFTEKTLFLEDASGIITSLGNVPERYDPLKDNKLNLQDANHNLAEWYRLVEKFTPCELTFDTDKIPAVLGLSRYYGEKVEAGWFLWGLWSRSLHQGLLWTNIDGDAGRIQKRYDAMTIPPPSWSWAHWTGPVKYPEYTSSCEAKCKLVSADCGELVINTMAVDLTDVSMIYKPRMFMGVNVSHQMQHARRHWVSLDGERKEDLIFSQVTLAFVAESHHKEHFTDSGDDKLYTKHDWTCYFLVLCVIEEEPVAKYRRVGMGAFSRLPWTAEVHHLGERTHKEWEDATWRTLCIL